MTERITNNTSHEALRELVPNSLMHSVQFKLAELGEEVEPTLSLPFPLSPDIEEVFSDIDDIDVSALNGVQMNLLQEQIRDFSEKNPDFRYRLSRSARGTYLPTVLSTISPDEFTESLNQLLHPVSGDRSLELVRFLQSQNCGDIE